MLRKIFLTISALAMLTAVSAANAGSVAVPVYPMTGSIKVKGTEEASSGAQKIFSGTGTTQKLIRMAMGGDTEVAVPNEKNLVLGYVPLTDSPLSCTAQVVVWNKVTLAVVGLVAYVNSCYGPNTQSAAPAPGKAGTRIFLQNSRIYFENNTSENCSSLNQNQLSGAAYAIGEYSSKKPAQGNSVPQNFKFTRLLGDVAIVGDDSLNVVDGTFTATFTKTLGTTSASLFADCPE